MRSYFKANNYLNIRNSAPVSTFWIFFNFSFVYVEKSLSFFKTFFQISFALKISSTSP